jgi:hypothetical protein
MTIVPIIRDFDFEHEICNVILLGRDGAVRNIAITPKPLCCPKCQEIDCECCKECGNSEVHEFGCSYLDTDSDSDIERYR